MHTQDKQQLLDAVFEIIESLFSFSVNTKSPVYVWAENSDFRGTSWFPLDEEGAALVMRLKALAEAAREQVE